MLSIISNLTALFRARQAAPAAAFILGDLDFNEHVYAYGAEMYDRESCAAHELWKQEQAEIQAEWDAMTEDEQSDIYCAFHQDWINNHPLAGEGRYGSQCMAMLPRKGLD